MAFVEYMFLIQPGLKALVNLARNLKAAKKNDGKIDLAEWLEAVQKMGDELFPFVKDIVRDPEDPTPLA